MMPHSCSNSHESLKAGTDTTMWVLKSQNIILVLNYLNCLLSPRQYVYHNKKRALDEHGFWLSWNSYSIWLELFWCWAELEFRNYRKVVGERNSAIILRITWFRGQRIIFPLLTCSWLLHRKKSIFTNPEVTQLQRTATTSTFGGRNFL